ncbi:PPC domain-containing protein [Plectonema radiosum NIES-515]|uniref:PPC domain-containing protein n=1 Tax=Plectonema radiosum NIES-515 TaxID=2986073 RepID=A0ABT3B1V2_9CYAN|nr:PPC domain-containing protein [Plectonema radiosum]MCV3215338.1 PPC domain-containing protein [Plectonema radiosum NIES-515]
MSSSFLIGSYTLPISALASLQPGGNFIIAKPPDERQPEAVQQGIEQIPTTQPSVSPKPNPPIDSPIPPATAGTTSPTPPPASTTPKPVNTEPTPPPARTTPQPVNTSPTPPPASTTPQPVNTEPTPPPARTTPKPVNTSPTPPPASTTPQPVNTSPTPPPARTTPKPVNSEPTPPPPARTTPKPVNSEPTPPPPARTTPKPVNTEPTPPPARTTPKPVNTEPTPPPARTTPKPVNTEPTPPPVRTTPKPVNSEPTPPPVRIYTPRPSTPEPSQPRVPSRRGGRKPATNQSIESSPVSPSRTLNYKQINFVDIAFSVLAPGDFKSQGRYFHFYQFQGRANQLIQIRLGGSADQRRSNNLSLDPFMFVLDPNNNVLLKRGSGGATSEVKDAFVFVRLPANGTYTIAVTSQNRGAKGRYSLALRNDRASYSLDSQSELTPQSLRRQDGSLYDISQFQGKKDQLVSIRVDSVYEEFSPYIVLLDSQGKIVAADNAKDGKYSALIDRARLPKDETYYVVVISGNSLQRGKYRLTVF